MMNHKLNYERVDSDGDIIIKFDKKLIIKHIRLCYPEMGISPSAFTVSSFLERDKVNDEYASTILKRITKEICDEISHDLGSVVIKEKLWR